MSNLKKFRIDKMIDNSDNLTTKKENNLFDLPMRLLMIAKTGDSKSTTLGNLLLKDEAYKKDFLPENVFVFSGSRNGDKKLDVIIEELEIEDENIFDSFDEEVLNIIYEMLVENFNDKVDAGVKNKKELNSLIIFDDLAYSDKFKAQGKEDTIKKIFMNGRKFLISTIVISQKYSSIGTILRENASGLIIGKASNKQVDLIEADHNYLKGGKKIFKDMFRDATDKPFSKLIINFSKPNLYYDTDFDPVNHTS
tara:strand:- start:534 stop:1289 length:756 start_codon:yes stop_codon:yes gene_type:complete